MPRHIRVKPNQVATLAWVVLQINVALLARLGADFGMVADRKNRRAEIVKTMPGNETPEGNTEALQDEIADRAGNVHT